MADWSPQQSAALQAVRDWLRNPRRQPIFRLFGFAGTGKTTIAAEVQAMAPVVLAAAYTGKAASVMASKGFRNTSTLHSLIYVPYENTKGETEWGLCAESELFDADLLIVDECSMVDETMRDDLLTFGTPILVLGDPFQLPPVSGTGALTNAKPDVMLTEIHRQARDNPIIRMSMDIREGKPLGFGYHGDSRVCRMSDLGTDDISKADMRIVGKNVTRNQWNATMRGILGLPAGKPVASDALVCLRNNKDNGLLNGTLWRVLQSEERYDRYKLVVRSEDPSFLPQRVETLAWGQPFRGGDMQAIPWQDRKVYDEFDFGYALTAHKSQGSQWDNIVVRDEAHVFRADAGRWLYTAVTRAAKAVTVVRS